MTIVLMSALLKKVKNGGSLNITCVAVGSPMPFVKWRQVCIHTIRWWWKHAFWEKENILWQMKWEAQLRIAFCQVAPDLYNDQDDLIFIILVKITFKFVIWSNTWTNVLQIYYLSNNSFQGVKDLTPDDAVPIGSLTSPSSSRSPSPSSSSSSSSSPSSSLPPSSPSRPPSQRWGSGSTLLGIQLPGS